MEVEIAELRSAAEALQRQLATGAPASASDGTLLIVWTVKHLDGRTTDHWHATDDEQAANKRYDELCKADGTYSVSVCKPIRSTDF